MEFRQHNFALDGSDIPLPVGDRQYAQDKARDFWHLKEYATLILEELLKGTTANIVIRGLMPSQGTGHTLSWTLGSVKLLYTTKSPTDWGSLPPAMTSHTIPVFLDIDAASNQAITGTTTDGTTVNYAKFSYNESTTSSRTRAKKTGSYYSEVLPSYTFTCNSTPPTVNEVCFATFTTNGTTIEFTGNEDRYNPIGSNFDYIVDSLTSWRNCIERTSANNYKIKDNIRSIKFKYLSGGYNISDILLQTDTYAIINPNNCTLFDCEPGTYFNVGDTLSYLYNNTDYAIFKNVDFRGIGSAAVAVQYSFRNNADYVKFINCKTSNRLSNTTFYGFRGNSSDANSRITSSYENCIVTNVNSSGDVYGFRDCENLFDCKALNLTSTGAKVRGFRLGVNLKGCLCDTFTVYDDAEGFLECKQLINCTVTDFTSSTNQVFGFNACTELDNSRVLNLTASAECYGFYLCENGNNNYMYNFIGAPTYGLHTCKRFNGIYIEKLDSISSDCVGIESSSILSNIEIIDLDTTTSGDVYGMNGCSRFSNADISDLQAAENSNVYGIYSSSLAQSIRIYQLDSTGTGNVIAYAYIDGLSSYSAGDLDTVSGNCYGVYESNEVSSGRITNITSSSGNAYGYYLVYQLTSATAIIITATTGSAYGFYQCNRIAALFAFTITGGTLANGFASCNYGSSLYTDAVANAGNDWIDTVDANITNKVSTPSVWT